MDDEGQCNACGAPIPLWETPAPDATSISREIVEEDPGKPLTRETAEPLILLAGFTPYTKPNAWHLVANDGSASAFAEWITAVPAAPDRHAFVWVTVVNDEGKMSYECDAYFEVPLAAALVAARQVAGVVPSPPE